ncbi:MAG: hypothetical protein J6Q78_05955 [Clostridia bacterium]|nr:hypothetical protein [Clostridia bacterium]
MFTVKMADIVIRIENKYDYIFGLCSKFIIKDTEKADMTVSADISELQEEIDGAEHPISEAYAEALVVYRKICVRLPIEYDGFLFHSALIEYEGRGYAFAAKSGTGKSTHISLWQKKFGESVRVINGDKPIFRAVGEEIMAYGTPWCGKENLSENASVPLKAICFIVRSKINSIRKIEAKDAIIPMFSQILRPTDIETTDALFALLEKTLNKVECYVLECNISEEAAEVAYNGMKE